MTKLCILGLLAMLAMTSVARADDDEVTTSVVGRAVSGEATICPEPQFGLNLVRPDYAYVPRSGWSCLSGSSYDSDPDQVALWLTGRGHDVIVMVRRDGTGKSESALVAGVERLLKVDVQDVRPVQYGPGVNGFLMFTEPVDQATVDKLVSRLRFSGG